MSRADKPGQPWNAPRVPAEFRHGSTAGRPGKVTAPGVLAIIFGVFGTLGAVVLVAMAGTAELRRSSQLSPEDMRLLGVGALVISLGAVIAGVFVLRGRSWARWLLTVLAVAYGAMSLGEFSTSTLIGIVLVVVVVAMLWTKDASQWFKEQRG